MKIEDLYNKNKEKVVHVKHYEKEVSVTVCGYATVCGIDVLIGAMNEYSVHWTTINKFDFIEPKHLNNGNGYIYLSGAILEDLAK